MENKKKKVYITFLIEKIIFPLLLDTIIYTGNIIKI